LRFYIAKDIFASKLSEKHKIELCKQTPKVF